jgi:quercetin dioxygenase-like cupin family protein
MNLTLDNLGNLLYYPIRQVPLLYRETDRKATTMTHIQRADSLRHIETPGGNHSVGLATPSSGATDVTVVRQRQAPGGTNPWHTHDRQEVVVMQSGSLLLDIDAEQHELASGDIAVIPAGARHRLQASGVSPAEWLIVLPSGARFIADDGAVLSPEWAK